MVFLLFLAATSLNSFGKILHREFLHASYQSWEISEWLINYEGGFVRRGLTGQLLWSLQQWFPYDIRVALMGVCIIASAVFLCLILRVFKKEGWSLLIIPTGFCLGFTLFNLWGRRDYISLMLTFSLFLLYRHVLRHPRQWLTWVTFYILSALQLLMHEASFFYTFPILMLYEFHRQRMRQLSMVASAAKCLLFFMPVLVTMCIACLFKGDQQTAETIWASWGKVFTAFQPDAINQLGKGVEALGWDAGQTFYNHLYTSFLGCVHPSYWGILWTLFNLVATYYLLTRVDCVKAGIYPQRAMSHTTMSDIALVQYVALLPMYTVLSCDWGRTLPYLVITSVFFYHLFKQEQPLFSHRLTRVSTSLQGAISGNRVLTLPVIYILLVLLTPIPRYHVPFDSLNTFQQKFWTELMHIINP